MENQYDGLERRAPLTQGWHLDKKVPLSLILAMIVQVVYVTNYLGNLTKEVELLKADNVVLHQRDTTMAVDMREALNILRDQYKLVDSKLDRLIERANK